MTTALRVNVTRADTSMTVALQVLDCAACGVIYAIGDEFERRRREDGKSFYCPNGHANLYGGEIDQLRTRAANAERQLKYANETAERVAHERDMVRASLTATKGVVTRMKRRAMAGACPFGCHRTFADLQRHIVSKHSDATVDAVGEAPEAQP